MDEKKNTIIVNAFAGPGAGKTTSAWAIAAELKKKDLVVEYVPEYAKELVWEGNFELLDQKYEHQMIVYAEQKRRIDRLMGKVDIIVTDAPTVMSVNYIHHEANTLEQIREYEEMAVADFKNYRTFNYFIERGETYEQAGRIQTLEQAKEIDENIKIFLQEHGIYFGTYRQQNLDLIADNIERNFRGKDMAVSRKSEADKAAEQQAATHKNIKAQIIVKAKGMGDSSEIAAGWVELENCIKFPVRVRKYEDRKDGTEKMFVSYPQRKIENRYEDIVYPNNKGARTEIDNAVFEAMKEALIKDIHLPDVEARVTPLHRDPAVKGDSKVRIKGLATIKIADLTIKGVMIKESEKGLFVQMPQHKSGEAYRDIVYGTTKTIQNKIKEAVMKQYNQEIKEAGTRQKTDVNEEPEKENPSEPAVYEQIWKKQYSDLPPLGQDLSEQDYDQIMQQVTADPALDTEQKISKLTGYERLRKNFEKTSSSGKDDKNAIQKCMEKTAARSPGRTEPEFSR